MIIQALYNWCDKRIDDLNFDDDLDTLKAFGYGMVKGIPEGLMLVGAGVYVLAFCNLIRGKGWTVCPKD